MPYADEIELNAGAMGHVMWTWPWTFGIPTLQQLVDKLFPRPLIPIMDSWPGFILDKWNEFADKFKYKLQSLAGSQIDDEEDYLAFILEAAEWAASEMGFDLWDEEEGLPSMPLYNAPEGPG